MILDRPYQFVPPCRNNLWPAFIQQFRIVDRYLRKKEGVVSYECRNLDVFRESLDRGDGILLAPNHCRYADPLVLGWPARHAKTPVYAMASWHLFNDGWLDAFAIRRMGAFSIFREGSDRKALDTAIQILTEAERPLIVFPEGTTNRTNDVLKPLLDGVTFMARAAARRREKQFGSKVVMHPIAIKYLCKHKIDSWAHQQLSVIESHLGWTPSLGGSILTRTIRVAEALLALREVQHLGSTCAGNLSERRDRLIQHLLSATESRLKMSAGNEDLRTRVRAIRTKVSSIWFSENPDEQEKVRLKNDIAAADLAQELVSYPNCYLESDDVTDARIVETIQRMQESLWGKADVGIELHAVIEFDAAIPVPAAKAPRGVEDPLLVELRERLTAMIARLSKEARPLEAESTT
ncbi:Phospholipid/glycerol acyltransferase domain protein [Rhodopirellula maiorica SM1]|uniref:Phospholipid/glycerol acyltransferase domain protein n=1 Tax=Rhodopirellula maiorica SM1 TaxID=1265738 RepID=M5RED1_9BACT|nr:Phospholipid/glycerol acyltransferase domain protein [Rhodopirellula maiorica SM1]